MTLLHTYDEVNACLAERDETYKNVRKYVLFFMAYGFRSSSRGAPAACGTWLASGWGCCVTTKKLNLRIDIVVKDDVVLEL